MSDGDAGGGGTTGGVGGDEEAAWRDLVARYEMPVDADAASVPWPDREDLRDDPADGGTGAADSAPDGTSGDGTGDGADTRSGGGKPSADRERSAGPGGTAGSGDGRTTAGNGSRGTVRNGDTAAGPEAPETPPGQAPGAGRTRVIRPATPPPASPAGPPAAPAGLASPAPPAQAGDGGEPRSGDDTGEHYVPPPPPPMPHLDSVGKGAWTALFGGPAYLFVSTLVGWKAPGWAALLAVVAFVGGFAVIVLRLGDKPSRGDGPDNGAVL